MEKIWLKSYPPGVPEEIDFSDHQSLVELFEELCEQFSEKPAFSNYGTQISFKELGIKSRIFAAYLQHDLGLKKGDRLAIMMPNVLQYPVVIFGALMAGLVVVNINPLYTASELTEQLNDSEALTIVVLSKFAHTVQEALPHVQLKNIIVSEMGDMFPFPKAFLINLVVKTIKKMVPPWSIPESISFKSIFKSTKAKTFKAVALQQSDVAFLQYTGGTTGTPKGAVLTHANILANLAQASAWIKPFVTQGEEIMITALPLYHIFSLMSNCLLFMKQGGLNVLITDPRDIDAFVKELSKIPFTGITGVNTLFNHLLHHPNFAKLDFSRLHLVLGGGMAIQKSVAKKWQEITGTILLEGYGLSETSPIVTVNPLDLKASNGSIGFPISSTEVSLRDEEGNEVGIGERGELYIKGPQVMREYWNKPEETKQVFTADGWFRSGDVATIDESGALRIVDRIKDMILVSGFNVYPNEIEDVIAEHPDVLEVAVIGIPDDETGEAVAAYVVKRHESLTEEKVIDHCRKSLTGYKIPHAVIFRDDLPKSAVGKVLRKALR